jgi:DNA-binding transcriptional MerR regulator
MPDDERYSLTELADLGGVTPRTVRYYLAQGLLPAVGQTGPGAKYDDRHLARLRLIRRLQGEHLPLAEIRRRLEGLAEDEIRELAQTGLPEPPTDSALEYLQTILRGPIIARRPNAPSHRLQVPPPRYSMTADGPPPAGSRYERPTVPEFTPPGLVDEPAPYAAPPGRIQPSMIPPSFTPSMPEPEPMERSQWDRLALSPDVELHIRRPLGRAQQKGVDRLIAIARELLEEERP